MACLEPPGGQGEPFFVQTLLEGLSFEPGGVKVGAGIRRPGAVAQLFLDGGVEVGP